jgi:hypothetical protein
MRTPALLHADPVPHPVLDQTEVSYFSNLLDRLIVVAQSTKEK